MSYNTSQQHSSEIPEAFPPVVQPTMSLDEFWDKHITHLPAKDTCKRVRISSGKSPPPLPHASPHGVRQSHSPSPSPSPPPVPANGTVHAHFNCGTVRRDSGTRRIINHSPPPDYSDPSVLSDTDHVHAGDAKAMRNPVVHGSFRPAMNRASSSSDSSFFTTEPLTINEKQAILDKNKDKDTLRRTYPKTYEQSYEIINMTLLDMCYMEINDYKILTYFNHLSKRDVVSVFVDLDELVAGQLTYRGKTLLDIIGILNNMNHINHLRAEYESDPSAMNHCCIVI